MDLLSKLAEKHGTDKWWLHHYTSIYYSYLKELRDSKINLLEIGIGAENTEGKGGDSLKMWDDFFTNKGSKIVGIDIFDKKFVEVGKIKTYICDQSNTESLKAVTFQNYDIIIDDGSHNPKDIIISFKYLIDYLNSGGLYIVEDTQTSYWNGYGGSEDLKAEHTTMNYFKNICDSLNFEEHKKEEHKSMFDKIEYIHFYHNLIILKKK